MENDCSLSCELCNLSVAEESLPETELVFGKFCRICLADITEPTGRGSHMVTDYLGYHKKGKKCKTTKKIANMSAIISKLGTQAEIESCAVHILANKADTEVVKEPVVIKKGTKVTINANIQGIVDIKGVDRESHIFITTPKKYRNLRILDSDVLVDLTTLNGMTIRQTELLVRILKENQLIEVRPGLLKKFAEKRKKLAKYFSTTTAEFDVTDGDKVRPIIFCNGRAEVLPKFRFFFQNFTKFRFFRKILQKLLFVFFF